MSRLLLVSAFAAFALACQSGAPLGTSCTTSSACGSPLVCRLGRCRNECAVNRDCPIGAQCFLDASGLGACQLDVDRSCGTESCGAGLTCLGSECVRACSSASECPADGVCTIASGASVGVCSDARSGIDAGPTDASTIDDAGTGCPALDAVRVCTGIGFSCAVRTDTSVVCWGDGEANQLGSAPPAMNCDPGNPTPCATRPIVVPLEEGGALTSVTDIACGDDFACGQLADGHVRCWGRNYGGMLGAPGEGILGARLVVDGVGVAVDGVTGLALGNAHACVLRGPSSVYCWGDNMESQLGRGASSPVGEVPASGAALTASGDVAALFTSSISTCIAHVGASAMELRCLGGNDHGQLTVAASTLASSDALTLLDLRGLDPTHPVMTGGDSFACAIDSSDHVQCWGWNEAGSLGRLDLTTGDQPTPAPLYGVAGSRVFTALFGGVTGLTTCGVTSDGLYCWGANGSGQAGQDPSTTDVHATLVPGLPTIESGSCGQQGCCAVDASHQLWCWGANQWGQLGRGTTSAIEEVPAHVCAP